MPPTTYVYTGTREGNMPALLFGKVPEPLEQLAPAGPLLCSMCGNVGCLTCSSCKAISWCSEKCREEDMDTHGKVCSEWPRTDRGSGQVLGLLFFETAKALKARQKKGRSEKVLVKPIWLGTNWLDHEGVYAIQSYDDVKKYLNLANTRELVEYDRAEVHEFSHSQRQDREIGHTLQIHKLPNGVDPSPKINEGIAKLTHGTSSDFWKGSIVLTRSRFLPSGVRRYESVQPEDLRHAVDFFATAYKNLDSKVNGKSSDEVWGVMVACEGEREVHQTAVWKTVLVPKHHEVFSAPISELSTILGLPIRGAKLPQDAAWAKNPRLDGPRSNQQVPYLFLQFDPSLGPGDNGKWGLAPTYWLHNIGNVLIVRGNGEDLLVPELRTLSRFCRFDLSPRFAKSCQLARTNPWNDCVDEVLKEITLEKFQQFSENHVETGEHD